MEFRAMLHSLCCFLFVFVYVIVFTSDATLAVYLTEVFCFLLWAHFVDGCLLFSFPMLRCTVNSKWGQIFSVMKGELYAVAPNIAKTKMFLLWIYYFLYTFFSLLSSTSCPPFDGVFRSPFHSALWLCRNFWKSLSLIYVILHIFRYIYYLYFLQLLLFILHNGAINRFNVSASQADYSRTMGFEVKCLRKRWKRAS